MGRDQQTGASVEALATRFLSSLLGEDPDPALVDWPRFRLLQIIPGTAGADPEAREQLVARGLVELARGGFAEAHQQRALDSLRALVETVLGPRWRVVPAYPNPMLEAFRQGPAEETPPNLHRFLTMVADVAQAAQAVTVAAAADEEGRRLMTLLFVEERYVGFLPGSQVARS